MKTVGIIAEYNPFHKGHAYQIEQAKALTGATYAVVLMSGNYVQRGTPAITDKYTRTKMALEAGADIVLELPVYYATASAELFSKGGISVLSSTHIIDTLSFGCETPDISLLTSLADFYCQEPKEYKEALTNFLKQGYSFPAAREKATLFYHQTLGCSQKELSEVQSILNNPNNILGLEYCKAIHQEGHPFSIMPVQRTNEYHGTTLTSHFVSASGLRQSYKEKQSFEKWESYIPSASLSHLKAAEHRTFPLYEDDFSSLLYYKLLQTSDLDAYVDCTPDLAKKIKKNLPNFKNFSDFTELLKSKDLVHTRISRILLHILLDLKKDTFPTKVPYTRLLGLKKESSHLLKSVSEIPIITKVADARKKLPPQAYALLEKEILCNDLYSHICQQKFHTSIPSEFKQSPIIR